VASEKKKTIICTQQLFIRIGVMQSHLYRLTAPYLALTSIERTLSRSVEDGAAELLDEPQLSIVHHDALEFADAVLLGPARGDSVARSLEHNGEVHTEDTSGGIVLDAEIDMLIDTEAERAY